MKRALRLTLSTLMLAAPLLLLPRAAHAYIDLAPTLPKIISDAPTIALVEVTAFDRDTHIVTLKAVRTLKGTEPPAAIQHEVAPKGGAVPRQVLQWATPGSRAVIFASRTTTLVCLGTTWYQVRSPGTGVWKLDKERPDLPLAYYGSVGRLAEGVIALLQNKGAVITVVAYGVDSEGAMFDLALNRQSLPGVVRVARIRATASMPGSVASASSNPAYFIGPGAVDENDLPALLKQIKSGEAVDRAEAADDLRALGRKVREATPDLLALLKDISPRVRLAAAAALCRVAPKETASITILLDGLKSTDAAVRRLAASYAAFAGEKGEPLVEPLAAMLSDTDETLRANALESISVLGPVAAKAVPKLIPMLDRPENVIDVADALGRIGSAASPALKRLTPLLTSDQPLVRWATVRAMSQIGGPDAHPVVAFMVKYMGSGSANEVEGYNMMIYLALLGHVAQDAVQPIQNFRLKNPGLPVATLWAISPETNFPWNAGSGFARFGMGRGGAFGNLQELIYVAYVNGLGTRLAPNAPKLAKAVMDNTAGDVPTWGYRILAADPAKSIEILAPYLKNTDLIIRERAVVALGYMGEDAEPARDALAAALKKAANEREQRLIEWAIRQIDGEE